MDNEKRMITWCRMWNEDPALAYGLMSDDCAQWSNRSADLDTVIGPEEQERFVAGYRARHVNVFSPRVFVDAGDRFAYLWDVRKADGQVLTGIDVNILKEDRIRENWTFVAERRCEQPDPGSEAAGRTDPAAIDDLCRRWVQLRNGRAEPVTEVVTDDFHLFWGAGPDGDAHGPAELAHLIERQAESNSPAAFTVHRQPVVDLERGHIAFLWTAETGADGASVGGVDLLTVRSGRFVRGWSLTGTRPFRY
ncbi:nuclear transport factor 2 family protein [Streptomyces sp. NPDC058279]|uniref:nuclear transport factor 2 family protein n=1 Tax=Streptomyces sp. NPDC058279 TaxID=3346418 RepID=UPI0036F166E3